MYNNFDELIAAFAQWAEKYNMGEGDASEVVEFRRLLSVYFDAQDNPPDGIIGVGAITYAEHKLREAQQ